VEEVHDINASICTTEDLGLGKNNDRRLVHAIFPFADNDGATPASPLVNVKNCNEVEKVIPTLAKSKNVENRGGMRCVGEAISRACVFE